MKADRSWGEMIRGVELKSLDPWGIWEGEEEEERRLLAKAMEIVRERDRFFFFPVFVMTYELWVSVDDCEWVFICRKRKVSEGGVSLVGAMSGTPSRIARVMGQAKILGETLVSHPYM